MFEVIGIAVVVYFLFKLISGVVRGAIRGTLSRARDKAVSNGIPYEFAVDVTNDPRLLKKARRLLVVDHPEVAEYDVYAQYACAIAYLYSFENKITNEDLLKAQTHIESFVRPQIDQLIEEGESIIINQITFVYFSALAHGFIGKTPDLRQVRGIIKQTFPEKEIASSIENGFRVASGSSDFSEQLKALMPVVGREVVAQSGEFLVKYTRKANRELETLMSSDDFDPAKVSPLAFLDV